MSLKRKLLNLATRHLYNATLTKDVLTTNGKRVFLGEKELSEQEVQNLKSEALYFKNSEMFKIMNSNVRGKTNELMFDKQECDDDMVFSKGSLWALEIQDNILKIFK